MKNRTAILTISVTGMVLLAACSIISMISDDGGEKYQFTSIHGQAVEIYGGNGPYRFDSINKAVMFRGFDIANLIIVVPVFLGGIVLMLKRRGMGLIVLASCNGYLIYNYMIGSLGNSYNELFLVWTSIFAAGTIGSILISHELASSKPDGLFKEKFPRKIMTGYMLVMASFLFFSYTLDIIFTSLNNEIPASLEHYTTLELASLELALMLPLHIIAALLLIRKRLIGSLLSLVLSFIAVMTFLSLTTYSLLKYFQYDSGTYGDILIPACLSVASGFCTLKGLTGVDGTLVIGIKESDPV